MTLLSPPKGGCECLLIRPRFARRARLFLVRLKKKADILRPRGSPSVRTGGGRNNLEMQRKKEKFQRSWTGLDPPTSEAEEFGLRIATLDEGFTKPWSAVVVEDGTVVVVEQDRTSYPKLWFVPAGPAELSFDGVVLWVPFLLIISHLKNQTCNADVRGLQSAQVGSTGGGNLSSPRKVPTGSERHSRNV